MGNALQKLKLPKNSKSILTVIKTSPKGTDFASEKSAIRMRCAKIHVTAEVRFDAVSPVMPVRAMNHVVTHQPIRTVVAIKGRLLIDSQRIILCSSQFPFVACLTLYMNSYFEGDMAAPSVPESSTQIQDINISTYLTPGSLPRPSISRVESVDPANPDDEPNENRVLLSLETPISASLGGLPRHLFVNTDFSTFCQSNTEVVGNSAPLMDVFLPEVIQTEGEETVICEEGQRAD